MAFLNQSWVIRENSLSLNVPGNFPGVIVAAAGNEPNRDFVDKQDDYARRVGGNDDTVAVLNIMNGRLADSSSTTSHPGAQQGKLLGFDGQVRPGVYGTSFAAPRVAWVMALAESLRKRPVAQTRWSYLQRGWLQAARVPQGQQNQFCFLPVQYLNNAINAIE